MSGERDLPFEQRELYEAMSDVSEISYCASWLCGNEARVWRLIHEGGSYGLSEWKIDDYEIERVRRASQAADCWIVWGDDDDGPRAVPLAEWAAAHPIGGPA